MRAYTRRRCVPSLHALRRSARWCHAASVRGHGGPRSPRSWARRPQGRAQSTFNTQTDKDLCARAECAALSRVAFPPTACTDNLNFKISAISSFSVSVRFSHFANPAHTSGDGTVGALARASVPSGAMARSPTPSSAGNDGDSSVGAVWCTSTRTGAGRDVRASSGGGEAGVVAHVRRGERLRERARGDAHVPSMGTVTDDSKVLANASAIRVDALLSLRSYAENDADEANLVENPRR